MKHEPPKSRNYCAVVVQLHKFVELENCDNVKGAMIFGNQVIVGKDTPDGETGLFFPIECALSKEFLGANNLFRKTEYGNTDPEKKGFFEEHGRVKAVKFRGHKSEGFFIPLKGLVLPWVAGEIYPLFNVGDEFDQLSGVEICRKYVPRSNRAPKGPGYVKVGKKMLQLKDLIVDGQFRFHPDTENLRKNWSRVKPKTVVSISDKWHGTSVVVGNLLTTRPLKWYEKLLARFGVAIKDSEYGIVVSSRKVIKTVDGETKVGGNHFYSTDIWGTVGKEIAEQIPKGFTVYGEIVGYTENGEAIQKGYPYGCDFGKHRLMVYRVTFTNADGNVFELPWPTMRQFCEERGLSTVVPYYYGEAGDLFVDDGPADNWGEWFVERLEAAYLGGKCPYNGNKVPAEGVVVRIDHLNKAEAYKLKSWEFLAKESKELDSGEADMETEEAEAVNE